MNDIQFCDPKGKRFKNDNYAIMFRHPTIIWIGPDPFHKSHKFPTIIKALSHESLHVVLYKMTKSKHISQCLDNEKVFKALLGRFHYAYC